MRDRMNEYLDGKLSTTDGQFPRTFDGPAPAPTEGRGQHAAYWVLSEAERAKGFVRPVRTTYRHERCGTHTSMGRALAETYARDPTFYGATFCCGCGAHFPVGAAGEFVWVENGQATTERVGT